MTRAAAVVVLAGLAAAAIAAAAIYVPRWLAGPLGQTEATVIVQGGEYRIAGYERFYDLHERIQAQDVKLAAWEGRDLSDRDRTRCLGQAAIRAEMVAEYNSASDAILTTGQWRADNLPARLDHREMSC